MRHVCNMRHAPHAGFLLTRQLWQKPRASPQRSAGRQRRLYLKGSGPPSWQVIWQRGGKKAHNRALRRRTAGASHICLCSWGKASAISMVGCICFDRRAGERPCRHLQVTPPPAKYVCLLLADIAGDKLTAGGNAILNSNGAAAGPHKAAQLPAVPPSAMEPAVSDPAPPAAAARRGAARALLRVFHWASRSEVEVSRPWKGMVEAAERAAACCVALLPNLATPSPTRHHQRTAPTTLHFLTADRGRVAGAQAEAARQSLGRWLPTGRAGWRRPHRPPLLCPRCCSIVPRLQ
jgi:hypothetical protein